VNQNALHKHNKKGRLGLPSNEGSSPIKSFGVSRLRESKRGLQHSAGRKRKIDNGTERRFLPKLTDSTAAEKWTNNVTGGGGWLKVKRSQRHPQLGNKKRWNTMVRGGHVVVEVRAARGVGSTREDVLEAFRTH